MAGADNCLRALGIGLIDVRPGFAILRMSVREDMTNGIGIGHGGMIFTLADAAFAFACNSHNQRAVAAAGSIDFLRPAHLGDVLTATATEQGLTSRHGIYDVRVENQHGETVALFRGKSSGIGGTHVDET
jgi:acyl-CoA thioesterase